MLSSFTFPPTIKSTITIPVKDVAWKPLPTAIIDIDLELDKTLSKRSNRSESKNSDYISNIEDFEKAPIGSYQRSFDTPDEDMLLDLKHKIGNGINNYAIRCHRSESINVLDNELEERRHSAPNNSANSMNDFNESIRKRELKELEKRRPSFKSMFTNGGIPEPKEMNPRVQIL